MGQVLHGKATTTHATRAKIQNAQESLITLAERYNINPKTVAKWRGRDSVEDRPCGTPKGYGSVLSETDEHIIVQVRLKTLLPLDDMYDVLKPVIPALSRSNLHRCLQRNGVSRIKDLLPEEEQKQPYKGFKDYAPGYLHIDTAEVRVGGQKQYLLVAIDRATRYVYVELNDNKTMAITAQFLKNALAQYPFKVTKILTDNGAEFSYNLLPDNKKPKDKIHLFDQVCNEHVIEHRTTKVRHPWTNGMVEAMNKKVKANTTKKYHYETAEELKTHLYHYILLYNFNQKLTALNRRTPFEAILDAYRENDSLFIQNPHQLSVGRNTYQASWLNS